MYRIEDKKPYAKKVISIFSNDFENGIKEAIKNNCDGIFLRKPIQDIPENLDLTLIEKLSENCNHLSFEDGFAKKYDAKLIEKMKNVKQLWLPNEFEIFDITKLNSIEQLTLSCPTNFKNISNLTTLDSLYIRDGINNFADIEYPLNLKELIIANTKIKSLEGIEKLQNLKKLELISNKKLLSISAINAINIENLTINSCYKINDLKILIKNKSIKFLYIDKLDSIKTISPIEQLVTLGFQDLKSGDVGEILVFPKIKELNFYPNKKHYSHNLAEINQILKKRNG
ncbi:MAG: leucine-rich repeat domain-containing protein [Bacteroidota bacterium]|uniref:Leucine-rich repeat domain-containing protein n=1 Tax=Capnocytophaga canis TaxID=1848903 RepID=A0A3A1YBV2_9FLAO|nr:leucine-rich repeat domain-containing protein [Capnocytophaga canis]MDO4729358.1 leucine-rich repeat domain-containing protein [Bacteroidota bacterium]RIY35165.1 hypothetical protein CKY20_11205 [Capnocytophaga canis]